MLPHFWILEMCMKLWDLGLWVGRLYFYIFLHLPYAYARSGARVVGLSIYHVAHMTHVGCIYMFLLGTAWVIQALTSLMILHLQICWAMLRSLKDFLMKSSFNQVIAQLFLTVMQVSRYSICILSQVKPVLLFAGMCVHTILVGIGLSLHVCFATISSKVSVRVHAPIRLSLPLRFHTPVNLKVNLRRRDKRLGRDRRELDTSQGYSLGNQELQISENPQFARKQKPSRFQRESISVVPSAATLIIVVCVGFLALMVVLGLVRIHSLHQRVSGVGGSPGASDDPKDPDLFWDDSALTIIVNPMESYQNRQACVAGAAGGQQEDEDSSDSEAADSPTNDERRIIESAPHRY